MNPFRKRSPASLELREGVEVSAPVAEPLDPRMSTFADTETPAVDSWAAAVSSAPPPPASPPPASPISSLPPPTKPTPRSPPPPVAPRRRRSQMAPKKHRVHETPEFPTSSDPFNPNPGPPLEPDQAPSPSPISRSPSTASANPFLLQIQQPPSDIRRSLDLSDSTPEPHAASDPRPGRQSLDAEAFKRLMLTGQSTAPTIAPESSSTDTSSVSRQSIFEPILETDTAADAEVEIETPRTSHEIEDDERALSPKLGCVVRPPPPPPPPPRSRGTGGGTKSPISPSLSGSPPPPPPPSRPASMYSISQIDKSLPPPPPPPQLLPLLALSPSQKRVAPSPPLSRRHSIQSKSNPVKTRPPPPPIRRTKTTNTRRLAITTLPAPPLPPLPRRISRSFTPDSQLDEGLTENGVGVKEDDGLDILLDLQKLQREVDELRGKYEGR